MSTPVDATYLADAVVLLRYFEARGEVRQALSVMKKRGSRHERTIREFGFDKSGIFVGNAAARVPWRADRRPRLRGRRQRRRIRGRSAVTDHAQTVRDRRVLVAAADAQRRRR